MTEITSCVKIQPRHLDRLAIVYVRQSHPQQQIKHPESVATQRRLRERIEQWGWPNERIRVLEGDLGKSGTSTVGRNDFAWLVSEVTLNHVGLVAGFQINRLAREDETICHLIKICSLFDTLLADQDGLYHPQDFNDRLVLTIKGLVGGVELHQIQQRMQHGRLERARRGEWLGATPIGYVLGADRKLILDPDEQVQQAIRQVFEQFDRLGAVSALLRHFHDHDLRLPVREPTAAVSGRIAWRQPHRETIRNLLRHPAYAGAFTWGRRRIDPQRAAAGRRGTGRRVLAPRDCAIFLRDNHPAYIAWERFEQNVQRLSSQRRHGPEPSSQREVVSLLAGRVFCGRCGARMQSRYSPRLRYECARRALDYGEAACASLPGEEIERLAAEQILMALEPASLELSLSACQRIESERAELDRSWQLRLERADHDAERTFRQYNAVEPENRLVARTLERQWDAALQTVRTLREEYDRFRASRPTTLSASERRSILALSTDLPRLWNSASVAVADKRRVAQLLLEKVVTTGSGNERVAIELHWAGGTVTRHEVTRRLRRWKDFSPYEAILEEVEKLASRRLSSREIAHRLNAAGYRTCRASEFTAEAVRQLRSRGDAPRTAG
jgi:DNA invertase Pin-like site-specific DNA recombinase